ncbi:hypothetical protein ACSVDE_03305 [Pseudalkalibacillus sp. Hm43]|uniref:hypothetical protein n=1 Tax=Pseudalkalibacillus sp. Hm43 TaxID=3450742 RepID=UPI003F43153A
MDTYKSSISPYFMLVFVPLYTFVLQTYGWYYLLAVFLLTYLVSSFNFIIQIYEQNLKFEVLIFKYAIYKKTIKPEQIRKITFKRTSWTRKSAVIHIRQGKNIRLIDFEPKTYCAKLEQFAIAHQIEIQKTKDFQLLERHYS